MKGSIVQVALIAASVICLLAGHEGAAFLFGLIFFLSVTW
jgi:hypothetical protein